MHCLTISALYKDCIDKNITTREVWGSSSSEINVAFENSNLLIQILYLQKWKVKRNWSQ